MKTVQFKQMVLGALLMAAFAVPEVAMATSAGSDASDSVIMNDNGFSYDDADTDKSGVVSKDEYINYQDKSGESRTAAENDFIELDGNKDGTLGRAEMPVNPPE